jgi:hypothetical protein
MKGLGTILFVVFLVLKLCGTIGWSWWWVTAPLWIPFGISLLCSLLIAIFYPDEQIRIKK